MCGLAGQIRLTSAYDPEAGEALVRRMCDRIAHRGPDDAGIETRGPVCLGSQRLSIIDLSAAGHMPMADESGRFAIVYNGEVYNFEALREELAGRGHRFRSRTDTEVVLHAFMEWGLSCTDRFVGMFAFAVHDREAGTVTLVRDRFGIKPLYYARTERLILFASEIKALLTVLDRRTRLPSARRPRTLPGRDRASIRARRRRPRATTRAAGGGLQTSRHRSIRTLAVARTMPRRGA
jgi:asparagine synthase (glutamine-hydrolysing)